MMDTENQWRLAAWAIRCDSRATGFVSGKGAFGKLEGKAIAARVNRINAPIHGGAAGWPADLGFDGDGPRDLDFLTYSSAAGFIRDIVMASTENRSGPGASGQYGPVEGALIESFACNHGLAILDVSEGQNGASRHSSPNAIAERFERMLGGPAWSQRKSDFNDWRPLAWAIYCESRYAGHDRGDAVFGDVAYADFIKRAIQCIEWRSEPGASMPRPADLGFARADQMPLRFLTSKDTVGFANAVRVEAGRRAEASVAPDWLPISGTAIEALAIQFGLVEPSPRGASIRATSGLAADEMFMAFETLLADPARQEARRLRGAGPWSAGYGDDDDDRRRDEEDERRRRDDEEQQRRDDEERDDKRREEADRWREEQRERVWRD